MQVNIVTKAQVKLLIEEELRKQSQSIYKFLNKFKERIAKLEAKNG